MENSWMLQRPGPGTWVTVVGLARSGAAAARWLLGLGCRVRVSEQNASPELESAAQELRSLGAEVETGGHTQGFIDRAELVVASPGVPPEAGPIRWAAAAGIPVIGELELASWYCPGKIVAVTGSNGKSTVVTLVGEILRAAGMDAVVCGNIGDPFCGQLERITRSTVVVLEVSSFQLETSMSFTPHVGCVLNVTDNHLNRHGSFKRYQRAKARMFDYQGPGGWAVLNADDPGSAAIRQHAQGRLAWFSRNRRVPGAWLQDDWLTVSLPGVEAPVCRRDTLSKAGPHHEENALAACSLAALMGADPAVIGRVLQTFRGLPHRQEVVATIRGVTFINDSKSTTVASSLRAIESAPGPVVLIAGGRDKGSDFRKLRPWAKKLKAAVLIGEDGPKIAAALQGAVPLYRAGGLAEAVKTAFGVAGEKEVVLLSPMCTSFDMFRDFEERGERFTEAVHGLSKAATG